MKKITILVPCYNEQESVELFYTKVMQILSGIENYKFELLFVNDGSKDDTLTIIKVLREKDENVSYLDLSRNFGKETAMIAGLDYCDGDAAIIMDVDLQDPPELIPMMIREWENGYADVYAKRKSRQGESFCKKLTSRLYYRMLQRMTDIEIQVDVGDFRLLDRQAVQALRSMRERQRYTKGMFSWIGYKKKEILFDRNARAAGKTKWNYFKLLGLAIDGITAFSIIQLRLASVLGIIISVLAFFYMGCIIIRTLLYGDPVAGYPSLISIVLFIGGIQLVVLGIIGEYLGRVFNEAKQRPNYLLNEYNGQKIVL